jgi:hypothetical protein
LLKGGQHLVGVGNDQNNDALTALLMDINRHPRMQGIYDNMWRAWGEEGGAEFIAFLSIGNHFFSQHNMVDDSM